ncbi:flagellar protein FlaG [Thermodesulfatator atlanticus]|uniref:flagellar protein FlaG n=1 Tax=Thermodesulfatator atlanticus TaxID=501497 RepID=UPI0003B74F97|nr:flagellar protein FlaG [Thermodesulfatator atlanticus]
MQVGNVLNQPIENISQSPGIRQEFSRAPTNKETSSQKGGKGIPKEAQESAENYKEMVQTIQKELEKLNVRLVFNLDEETKEVVVQVVDPETNKVIRQIPPEELLEIRKKLDEIVGILFEARV